MKLSRFGNHGPSTNAATFAVAPGIARSGTETSTCTQHNHNNQRNRRENQADAIACRQGFEFVKRKFRIHPHVWFAVSGIDLEVHFPRIRKGFSRSQFWDPSACRSKSCDLTEHGDACNDARRFLVVSVYATGCLKRDFYGLGWVGLVFVLPRCGSTLVLSITVWCLRTSINMSGMLACCLGGCPRKCGRQAFVSTHVCHSSTPEVTCLCDDMWSSRV